MHSAAGLVAELSGLGPLPPPRLLVIVLSDLAEVHVRAYNHLFRLQAWIVLDKQG